jgi:hypothetical protein
VRTVFADTFYSIALTNPADPWTNDRHFEQEGFQALFRA